MVNIVPKSSEQKDAEAEVKSFKDDLGPFVVAAEQNPYGDGVRGRHRR